MKIYIICPVRHASEKQTRIILSYVKVLEDAGHEVFYPARDAPQNSETGYEIVMSERKAIKHADRIDIFWDINSIGSHVDLGIAIAFKKELNLVRLFQSDTNDKSYVKVVHEINKRRGEKRENIFVRLWSNRK